ncbi:efflux RND transporter periplasmic adaptor subunit [Gimibacter soli]|uniref:Efflux RND transporter periplasmic adaptor subunit n=1 Tax=Gimibacter soli TaxID=3024400 RepID=A0AAE9XL31_9PROT|nr:efflux RND transporter periplasmic adaptor subunit [Gimibacter soli]WCL52902.1 efflux RND transporter periplasmic adaptor subunit [Gimibacter soli]
MKYSIKFALLALVSPLAINAATSGLVPQYNAVFASEQDEHGNDHAEAEGEGHGEEENVKMTDAELHEAGVVTASVAPRPLAETLSAPGEVTVNQYATLQVTPRIEAQVVARHVRMGDAVRKGQPLVTLSSVDMAEAQASLILADQEWQRVQKLGRDVVSEQRFLEAKVAAQQAKAKVLAYGMSEVQVKNLLANEVSAATGEFDLLANQDGTIIHDTFVVGQIVEPGNILFEVSDESRIWVEAQLSPEKAALIERGAQAWVTKSGVSMTGTVVQVHHRVDEATRTLSVRIEVDNRQDSLHAGQFAGVEIQTGETDRVVAVPDSAIVLLEGQQVVFKREGDELHPMPLDTGISKGGWTEVKAGLFTGDVIVVENAFHIKSLILKSKMGEGHGH